VDETDIFPADLVETRLALSKRRDNKNEEGEEAQRSLFEDLHGLEVATGARFSEHTYSKSLELNGTLQKTTLLGKSPNLQVICAICEAGQVLSA
jgi:hypothetical protein